MASSDAPLLERLAQLPAVPIADRSTARPSAAISPGNPILASLVAVDDYGEQRCHPLSGRKGRPHLRQRPEGNATRAHRALTGYLSGGAGRGSCATSGSGLPPDDSAPCSCRHSLRRSGLNGRTRVGAHVYGRSTGRMPRPRSAVLVRLWLAREGLAERVRGRSRRKGRHDPLQNVSRRMVVGLLPTFGRLDAASVSTRRPQWRPSSPPWCRNAGKCGGLDAGRSTYTGVTVGVSAA